MQSCMPANGTAPPNLNIDISERIMVRLEDDLLASHNNKKNTMG